MPEPAATPTPASAGRPERGGAEIVGLGIAVPERVVANAPIAARLGIEEDWIVSRTGIHERRIAGPDETVVDLGAGAAERALASAGVEPLEVDTAIVATFTNEELTPAAAARVTARIGATRSAAFDVNAACTGFITALQVGCSLIEARRATNVLVIGADKVHSVTDHDDRSTAALFGDGAGAIVLRGAARGRVGPVVFGTDGENADLIYATREEALLRMEGHETFRHAVDRLSESTSAAVAAAGLELDDVDLFVYHQANGRILRSVAQRLDLPSERIVDCIANYGNVSAATVPLALEEARRDGRLRDGARVVLGAFAAGLVWGATVIEWGGGSDAS